MASQAILCTAYTIHTTAYTALMLAFDFFGLAREPISRLHRRALRDGQSERPPDKLDRLSFLIRPSLSEDRVHLLERSSAAGSAASRAARKLRLSGKGNLTHPLVSGTMKSKASVRSEFLPRVCYHNRLG